MVLTCPHCHRSLSSVSADGPPQFCMFCGHKLAGSTHPPAARTQTFAPGADALSGVPDEDDLSAAPEPALKEIGGYRIGKLLGAGGMGSVYEAEALGTGRRAAVKLLSSRLASSPSSVERFRQEGRLASQLAHPRCVFVLAADTEHGRPYIVMELMPGRTLKDLVDQGGPLKPHEAIGRILDVIDGLMEAHRVGMIHRDVKPSNCFLTEDGRVKVGDFGLSKSLAGSGANHLTQTGAFLGTVLFAAPEQIRGEPLDYSSDVYSVAATLYFLLSGQAPFHHDSAATALARAISDPAPRIRATRPDVSEQLERIILRGLERDRSRRWQTLDDMREALADLLPERQRPGRPRALVGAYVLDRILLAFIVFPAEAARIWVTEAGASKIDVLELRWLAVSITLLYFGLFEGLLGATPGKMLFGLRVSRAGETDPPGVPRALARTFVLHAVLACFFLVPDWVSEFIGTRGGGAVRGIMFGIGALALSVQLRKRFGFRGLHDFASGCRVTQVPLRARRLRLPVAQPTPIETLLPPTPEALPEAVGGYVVNGRLSADPVGEQVWIAEDRTLGRKVLLWLRPWGGLASGAEPARTTRLRRLGAGSVGWGETVYDWTAYAAPLGGPLIEAVRPGATLPWADARFLLEQIVEEFRAAEADGSVPSRLALDHVWVEPAGRVQVLDFPLGTIRSRPGPPLQVLREAAALVLEGSPRHTPGPVAAPLPPHAAPVLDRLFTTDPPLAEFQKELADTHAHKPEVTPVMRAAHLGIQAPLLAVPLGSMFGFAFVVSVMTTWLATSSVEIAERAAAGFTDPDARAKLSAGDRDARAALSNPQARARVEEVLERARADAHTRRAALFAPQRNMLEQGELALPDHGVAAEEHDAAARALLAWAGATDRGDDPPWGGLEPLLVLFGVVPLGLVTVAAVLRGGASMMLAGMAIVRADGRRARRWQCALRAAVVWGPLSALLLACAAAQIYAPHRPYLAAGLWLAGVVLLPVYGVIALRYPTRPPQDRIAGTYLVPV
ncbi:Serine/threonine-protein kinase PknB [Gemmata obscuriglobus]|uniref:Protein kinase domain-containing protein n=1 Tax=Gemmata obscuriglobus TaxID=114 RepID=A0A2Z3HGD7_9BACT|nr:protein kinase [Gemmata obscuriglobus]AWM42035.1 hypothetical protein C1280_36955 [Gemmata obscuriglobus]QEG31972.1 Serine/threonine-protein kinase PknB [Gemmata obscuriglobus]VTS11322.1 serine threonine protein kinase : Serine/threonine protein kinase OS=Isosphaera pallida (strain ATCC 43644 / DSM 9630 / IS1B) GN=Isop_1601 PE=4 SV=1: Pkinase: RDD [Gemmata obscuriglobus UQM 2246]